MRLKAVITALTLALGLQLVWTGTKLFKAAREPLRSGAPPKVLAPASSSLYQASR